LPGSKRPIKQTAFTIAMATLPSALVDVIGDEDYLQSKVVDFLPDLLPILKYAVETEEGNWDDAKREPDWMQAARAAITAAGSAQ
jgi:hypothetical protein